MLARKQLRLVDEIRKEENLPPGVIPIDVDMKELMKNAEYLDRFYSLSISTPRVPVLSRQKISMKKVELKGFFGYTYTVWRSKSGKEVVFLNPETGEYEYYRLYRIYDASERPIYDSFYYNIIGEGKWYYYMPGGTELSKYDSHEDFTTNQHLLINWETGTILTVPKASIAEGFTDDLENSRKLRAAILAMQLYPPEFRTLSSMYFSGNVIGAQKYLKELSERIATMEREKQERGEKSTKNILTATSFAFGGLAAAVSVKGLMAVGAVLLLADP